MKPATTPAFHNPPIAEIGIGVSFPRPAQISLAHLGEYWGRVAREFPKTEDHSPSGTPGEWAMSVEGMPLPRLWALERDGQVLLQLQLNRFGLNWRQLQDSDKYISFSANLERFMRYWALFCEMVRHYGESDIALSGAEVLKISHVREHEGWSGFESISSVTSVVNWHQPTDDSGLTGIGAALSIERADARARFDLKSGILKSDPARRVLIIEIRVEPLGLASSFSELGNLAEKLSSANELANVIFTTFTCEGIQDNAWRRTR